MDELIAQVRQMLAVMSEKDVTDLLAKMYWNLYQSLKEQGFNDEQAFVIASRYELKK